MPHKKWTPERLAKFRATMAARKRENGIKRTPREMPSVVYRMSRGGRLERLRLRTVKVYIPD